MQAVEPSVSVSQEGKHRAEWETLADRLDSSHTRLVVGGRRVKLSPRFWIASTRAH